MSSDLKPAMSESAAGGQLPADLMDERVRRLKTLKDCMIFIKNVTQRGRPDLAHQAYRRAVCLQADESNPETPLERAWFEAINARGDVVAHRDGKPIRVSRSRLLLRKYGVREAITRSLAVDGESSAYEMLKTIGLEDFSFENTVLRFPQEFTEDVLARAKTNLALWV